MITKGRLAIGVTKGKLAIGVTKGRLAQADSFIEGSFGLLWMKPSGDTLY